MIYRIYDENNRFDNEITELIEKAASFCLGLELGECYDEELPLEISISVVGKDEIHRINREFRNVDSVTDVLSFPQYPDAGSLIKDIGLLEEEQELLLGDVVICYDVAAEQALEYGTGERRELVYLFVHSLLHLLGYDHMEEEERSVMREREERVMEAVGLDRR